MVRSITAPVKFLKWQDLYRHEKPFELFVDLPKESQDQRRTNIVLEEKDVLFQDVRGKHHDFDLDHHAFMFTLHRSSLTDYAIREEVEKIYLPEVENLIKSTVEGADKVTIFDWRVSINPYDRVEFLVSSCLSFAIASLSRLAQL